MPKIRLASGLAVHYVQVGQGPDLVMLHGLTGNLAMWHLRVVPLLRPFFRILTYDLRGHGYSDCPPTGYTTVDMAKDLTELLDVLAIPQASLVGHSYGADVALSFAILDPQRVAKLVAAEPALPAVIQLHKDHEWAAWEMLSQALAEFGFSVPPDKQHDVDYMLHLAMQMPKLLGLTKGRARRPQQLLRLLQTSVIRDCTMPGVLDCVNITRIEVPVLLVYGVDSVFLKTYEFLRHTLPNVQEVLLPASAWGHLGPIEHPDIFAAAVREFVQR